MQTTDFLDLAPTSNSIISNFKGYQGRNLNKLAEVPIIGELALHNIEAESTDDTLAVVGASTGKLPTAKATITQKKVVFRITLSDEEVRYSNVVDVVATAQRKLGDSFANTLISAFINGDTDLTADTNINLAVGTP